LTLDLLLAGHDCTGAKELVVGQVVKLIGLWAVDIIMHQWFGVKL